MRTDWFRVKWAPFWFRYFGTSFVFCPHRGLMADYTWWFWHRRFRRSLPATWRCHTWHYALPTLWSDGGLHTVVWLRWPLFRRRYLELSLGSSIIAKTLSERSRLFQFAQRAVNVFAREESDPTSSRRWCANVECSQFARAEHNMLQSQFCSFAQRRGQPVAATFASFGHHVVLS